MIGAPTRYFLLGAQSHALSSCHPILSHPLSSHSICHTPARSIPSRPVSRRRLATQTVSRRSLSQRRRLRRWPPNCSHSVTSYAVSTSRWRVTRFVWVRQRCRGGPVRETASATIVPVALPHARAVLETYEDATGRFLKDNLMPMLATVRGCKYVSRTANQGSHGRGEWSGRPGLWTGEGRSRMGGRVEGAGRDSGRRVPVVIYNRSAYRETFSLCLLARNTIHRCLFPTDPWWNSGYL